MSSSFRWYQQGSRLARFLLCRDCGVLVAVTFEQDGHLFGALNAACLDEPYDLGAAISVSPQLLHPEEKSARWRQVWVPEIELIVKEQSGA